MIWHIFKKDAVQLWPFTLALTIAQAVGAVLVITLGRFHEPRELAIIASFYPYLIFLGMAVLTITAAHQEPLAGVRQDWLMRPINRRELLSAKALFVILMIHAPILVVDVAEQLVLGFSFIDAVAAAASRGVELLCVVTLPALLLGAVTASLMEAVLFGLVVGLTCTALYTSVFIFAMKPPELSSGVSWIAIVSSEAFMVIGAALTLAFAYSRRRLLTTRIVGVLVVLAAAGILGWLPFDPAFAIQQAISGTSALPGQIDLRLASTADANSRPGGGKEADAARAADRGNPIDQMFDASRSATLVHLPLQISGLPLKYVLLADQVAVRISGADGGTLYQGVGICVRLGNGIGRGCRTNTLSAVQRSASDLNIRQQLYVPAATYVKLKNRPVTLELDLALTLLQPGPTQTIAALGDERQLAGLGSCATRIDADGDEVELRCLSPAAAPSCATAFLDESKSGLQNPVLGGCDPKYVPFPQGGIEDVFNPFGISLPFRDLSGLAHYPVDETRIQGAQIHLVAYQPIAHFRRRLVIPNIRLADWELSRTPTHSASGGG